MSESHVVDHVSPGSVYYGRKGSAECVVLSVGYSDPEVIEPFVTYQNGGGRIACCEECAFLESFQLQK